MLCAVLSSSMSPRKERSIRENVAEDRLLTTARLLLLLVAAEEDDEHWAKRRVNCALSMGRRCSSCPVCGLKTT